MKTDKKKVLILLLILTLIFIWGNSLFDRDTSAQESRFIVRILEAVFGEGNVSEHFVRKLAHFSEYAVLGAELYALFNGIRLSAAHGLFVAVIDETIQLLVKRGSSLADVWLDFSGVVVGTAVLFALMRIINNRKQKKENNR